MRFILRTCRSMLARASIILALTFVLADGGKSQTAQLDLPDGDLVVAYQQAAAKNVLAAVNPKVFFGYWSVCADGKGFGYGNTYPSLDGHQLTDALLWLGQFDVVRANWDYVRSFQFAPDPISARPFSLSPRIHLSARQVAEPGACRNMFRSALKTRSIGRCESPHPFAHQRASRFPSREHPSL